MYQSLIAVWDNAGEGFRRFATIVSLAFLAITIIICCYLANVAGHPLTGAFACGILSFALVSLWVYPVLTADDLAANTGHLGNYFTLLANIEIWLTAAFAATVFPDYTQHPEYFLLLAMSISIVSLAFVWGYKQNWAKPFIYWGAVAVTAMLILVLISNTLSPALFGFDLFANSKAEKDMKELNSITLEGEKQDAVVAKLKKAKGEYVSPAEEMLIAKYGDPSLFGKIKSLFASDDSSDKSSSEDSKPEVVTREIIKETIYVQAPATVYTAPTTTEKWLLVATDDQSYNMDVDVVRSADHLQMVAKYKNGTETKFEGSCSGDICSGNMHYNGIDHPFEADLSNKSVSYKIQTNEKYSFSIVKRS